MSTTRKTEFEKALRQMPHYIGGRDPLTHTTVADLCFLVRLQLDLFEEGDASDIKTRQQYAKCLSWLRKWE